MLYPTSQVEVSLLRRHILRFTDAAGLRLRVLAGTLWVTQEREPDDIVLEPGQSFVLTRQGQTVISALKNARVVIVPAVTEDLAGVQARLWRVVRMFPRTVAKAL